MSSDLTPRAKRLYNNPRSFFLAFIPRERIVVTEDPQIYACLDPATGKIFRCEKGDPGCVGELLSTAETGEAASVFTGL